MTPNASPRLTKVPRAISYAGFSLLELIVVITLLAVVLALSLPTSRPALGKPKLEMATARLVATLRTAHAEAVRTNADRTVRIDVARATIEAEGGSTPYVLGNGIEIALEDDGLEWVDAARRVRFHPDGTATGAIFILNQNGLTTLAAINP